MDLASCWIVRCKKGAKGMKLTGNERWQGATMKVDYASWLRRGVMTLLLIAIPAAVAFAQAVGTTTVQGTVYLANGQPGAGTLIVSWPAFTTAAGQAIAADSTTVAIAADGFVSVNLAPNQGATPAGEYYTAVYYMSDGTVNTEYWVVPAAAQASLAQVRAQVMPAAQAVQTVSKAYVDQSIAELEGSLLTASGGTLNGPLYLNADPTQPMQAATKHYVDTQVATAVPLAGGTMTGALTTPAINGVQAPASGSAQTTLQAAMNAAGSSGAMTIPPNYAGTDTFTNLSGVKVTDLRTTGAQQTERSVKEFGAVCDGVTDDTNALQEALNYANAHGVSLTIPEGTCKTRSLNWHGESIGGLGKQVSALMGFPGQDVLASAPDTMNILSYTRLHDLAIYVDQSVDESCSPAEGRASAGLCQTTRVIENNSIFSQGGNGLTNSVGTGAGWWVGNCAIAMPASTGAGGNGLKVAEIENVEIATTGVDPLAAQYQGAHSTHTCGMYLAQWPQWSEFRNIDIRGVNTGIAIPALPVAAPAGLNADSNRWQNVTIQAAHAFAAAAGSNNVLDNVVAWAGNSAATAEPPTGLVLDLSGSAQGWTVRNAVVVPTWNAVQPALTLSTSGGAVTAVAVGSEHGLGWDPYGTSVPLAFSGSCTAQATAAVSANGSISGVTVTQGGVGCSATTTAGVNAAGTWDTAAPVNLIGGQNMTLFAGNLLKGSGGYTVWNASNSASYGMQLDSGGGVLPAGGSYPALVATTAIGSAYQVDQLPGADFGAKLQACINAVSASYGGTCDARNFTGILAMGSNVTISTGNTTVLLPCATIATANQIVVTAGTRNVSLRGCAMRGGSAASGSQGGTAFAYSGTGTMVQVGDPTYAVDSSGFHLDNAVINTTGATAASAQGFAAYRTQEIDLEDMYFLGNANQTGMTLDGTGNYTGGTFRNDQFGGFLTAVNAIGHQVPNPATTDWMNASTFLRLHIDCPTSNGSPIAGTYGINLQQGDGNTFTGGDVEGCATALHLGQNAQNNTVVGLRNENSTNQVVADAGSSYNSWMTGGTMFTGKLTDNGTRNSFLDTFHRSFNGLNGDWYGSQQDATVTNHFRLGIGAGNERGLQDRYQTDYGYRWTTGLSDATGGEQFYQILDELNNVYRLSIGQYNSGQSSTNNQTVINSAGTGAVVLNGSNGAGTGGVIFGSGGPSEGTVATVNNAGNAQFNGTLLVGGTSQSTGTMTVRNNADNEVDYYLWPGLTTSQKGSYTYKDWNGSSQWYMVKDASNNWALNSATGGLDSFKAYQSTNSGDTYLNTSNSTGHIRLNYENGSGTETDIYSGSSANLDAAFLGPTSIKMPGLAASSGHYCLQIDNSGYITNTGAACGTGSGSTNGMINTGSTGQIAYYTTNGTTVGGMNAVPISAGGTGASTAAAALASLGGISTSGGALTGPLSGPGFTGPLTGNVTGTASGNLLPANNLSDVASSAVAVSNLLPGVASDGKQGITAQGNVTAAQIESEISPQEDIRAFGAVIDGKTPIDSALQAAVNAYGGLAGHSGTILLPCAGGCYWDNPSALSIPSNEGIRFMLQGDLTLGSMLVAPSNEEWHGDGSGWGTQYEEWIPGTITSPDVAGTLGAAISTPNQAATITPTFTNGNLAHLPAGTAITIAGTASVSATAVRTTSGSLGESVFTLSSSTRFVVGEIATITGCSDSSFNATNIAIANVDYVANTVTVWQSTSTPSTATGCTVTSLNADTRESVRVFCSNGTGMNGYTCGTGQITIYPRFAHAATDQFAEVAAGPSFNTYNPQSWENISIQGCYGDCFWAEGSTNLYMKGMGFAPANSFTAGTLHFTNGYFNQVHNSVLGSANLGQIAPPCPSGGCVQPSYPYVLVCDGDAAGLYYQSTSQACGAMVFDDNSVLYGGALVMGEFPRFSNVLFEEVPNAAVTVDNRNAGLSASTGCIVIEHSFLQDGILDQPVSWVAYTNAKSPGGCVELNDLNPNIAATIANQYFNGVVHQQDNAGFNYSYPYNATSPGGTYITPSVIAGEVEGIGSGFGPSLLPFGSLAVTTSPTSWQTICGSSCVISGVPGPDGPSGRMQAAEIDKPSAETIGALSIGTWTGATYPGDHFIYGSWTKPGANEQNTMGYQSQPNEPFYLGTQGTDTFAVTSGNNTDTAFPDPFGTSIGNNGWVDQVAIATITGGESASHAIAFNIQGGNYPGGAWGPGYGNQFAQPFWAFIPGPNNPACTAAGTCNLTIDQITKARRDQYHGCVPPNIAAGQAATCETVNIANVTVPGAPAGSYVKADGTGYGTPSGGITQLTGDVTAGPGNGSQAAAVVRINGGAVPASAALLGTNSSAQPVAVATIPASAFPALTGDVTSSAGSVATTVGKVNGGTIPSSAALIGTNGSQQLVAATASQIVAAIGTSAVANATSFTGSLSGDVTGTQGATTVNKINGGPVSASTNLLATNASSQPIAATAHNESVPRSCATTNTGNAYSCSTTPTFTPVAGDTISINFNAANTGSATLAVNGSAAATIKKWGNSSSLTSNDLLAGHWISATYDGTYWQLEGQLGNANATQVNGAGVPASATVVGSNSSSQLVSATTTGSGNVVLATSPTISGPTVSGTLAGASETLSGTLSVTGAQTLTGATTMQSNATLQNSANSSQTLAIQPGSSADQIGVVQFNNYSGTAQWQLRKDASNYLRVTDSVNSLDRGVFYQNGNTIINSGAGANAVAINNTSGSGTGGFTVYEGGTNYSTAALQVTGSGNTTATGFLQGKFMIGTGTMTFAAGAAAGTSPSIVCATSHVCDGVSGTVTLTTGTSPTSGTLATLSFPNTHTNQANCVVMTESASAVITSNTWSESTTAITITANVAPAASTAYTLKYWCGGN
jgi:hypothetical protein